MPVFLTPQSKVALLEQSMKIEFHPDPQGHSTCFPMVLFLNKSFMNLARKHSVYRLCMYPCSQVAKFRFEDNETESTWFFEVSVDQAYKWIKFLNPPFFNVHECSEDSPYFCLMGCVNDKIGFDTSRNNASTGMTKCFWFQINELTCTAEFLQSSVAALPSKKFDRLCIRHVGSTDDLKRALKQKTTRLDIHMGSVNEFVKGIRAPNEEAFVNNIVEKCVVDLRIEEGPIFGIISTIIETCPNLKHLKVDCASYKGGSPTFELTLGHLARTNAFIKRLVKKLKEASSVECVIDGHLYIRNGAEGNKYPRDCVEIFRDCLRHFEPVQEETEYLPDEKFRTVFTIKHRDQNVSIDYKIYIYYNISDYDVDEIYENNFE